jgi:hypothetical protein
MISRTAERYRPPPILLMIEADKHKEIQILGVMIALARMAETVHPSDSGANMYWNKAIDSMRQAVNIQYECCDEYTSYE